MRRVALLSAASRAAEELASSLLGYSVRKAIDPLSPHGFVLIGEMVSERLRNVVAGGEAAVIKEVIGRLGLDWARLSPEAATRAMNAVNKAIRDSYATRVLPKISGELQIIGPNLMKGTKQSILVREQLDISGELAQRDLVAEEAIRKSQVNFIRLSSGERADGLTARARDIVSNGVEQGYGTDQIGKDLRDHFTESIPRPESYWRVVADSFVGRARTTSQVYAYEDASISTYEVVAVIDEVTTDQCRFMDGMIFKVAAAREMLDSLQDLEDPEEVKYANPWIRKGRDPDGGSRLFIPHADGSSTTIANIDRSGVGEADDRGEFSDGKDADEMSALGVPSPPFHARCRTTIVAGSESADTKPAVMVPGADLSADGEPAEQDDGEETDAEKAEERVPAGSPDGGQWTSSGGGPGSSNLKWSATGEVVRPDGWKAANDLPDSWTRPGHLYRGMTEQEWDAHQEAGHIQSTGAYSHASEGTNFADDARSAESYANYGRDDPRTSGKATYLVEIHKDPELLDLHPDGYYKANGPVPLSAVTRAWKMVAEKGEIVAYSRSTSAEKLRDASKVREPS